MSAYERLCKRVGEEALVVALSPNGLLVPASWFSPQDFCLAWADAPHLIEKLTAVMAERIMDFAERICKAGVRAFRIIGGEYATVQLGPEGFKRLCVPYDKDLVAVMHKYGAVVHYHNHGPVMRYLSDFADIGFDSLDPLEAPPWGDADLREARRQLGNRVCFVGNIDDMEIIDKWPSEKVLALARERLEAAGERGFMLGGTSSATFGEHGARNFIAMAEMLSAQRA